MADFDLTQTDQQVQNILNDAQGAMGAGAQTTLTTEYVMLKDTNGVYHKILKSSFTEAIRDVLAGLLVNNDKGTTINQIAAIASGDFGSITPANLASALGVLTNKTQPINSSSSFTIDKGDKTAVLYCWANTDTSSAPAIIMCARKSLTVHVDTTSLVVNQDISNAVCVNIDSSTGNIIVKNNYSSAKNFSYLLLRVEI